MIEDSVAITKMRIGIGSFPVPSMVRIYSADLTKIFVLRTNSGGIGPFDGRLSSVSLNPIDTLTTLKVTTQDIYQPVGFDVDEDDIYVSNDTLNKH